MSAPPPSREFLTSQVHWAMGRGLPAEAAEDVVFAAWERASAGFDPQRGSFEAFMQRIVRRDCAYWWRTRARARRAATQLHELRLVNDAEGLESASRNQAALIEALEVDERAVFAAWALQKHLGKGRVTSVDMSQSLGLELSDYENAKRRLRKKLETVLRGFGWSVQNLLYGDDHVDRTG